MKGNRMFKNRRRSQPTTGTFPVIDLTVPQPPKPTGSIDIVGAYLRSPRQNREALLGEKYGPGTLAPTFLNP